MGCILRLVFFVLLLFYNFGAKATSIIEYNDTTPVIFNVADSEILVLQDASGSLSLNQVKNRLGEFKSASEIDWIDPRSIYWSFFQIKSSVDEDRQVGLGFGFGWESIEANIVKADGTAIALNKEGFFGNYNNLATTNPRVSTIKDTPNRNAVFLLKANEEVTVFTKLRSDHMFPARGFSVEVFDNPGYLEHRRLGLYFEGLLLGALIALSIFGCYSAARNRDLTSFHYAMWIVWSCATLLTQFSHDGIRLFEFMSDIGDANFDHNTSWGSFWLIFFACGQSITYAIFARRFLDLQNHFPKVYFASNLYIAWYSGMFLFYMFEDAIFPPQYLLIPHFLSTFVLLIAFFACAYLRYLDGMRIARFFMIALVPYLLFRSIFLFYFVGLPTPMSYLPENGLGLFLREPSSLQALGIVCEAMIMALAVIARTRWLQDELTQNVREQNIVLEATVAERTRELKEQHEELDRSHQVVVESLNYASRLQKGQLPRKNRIEGRFKNVEAIWEPRDTIGGDLWWMSPEKKGPFVVALADCTGHGVPGAMLSILVSSSLDRLYVSGGDALNPSEAIMALDSAVRNGLNQDEEGSESDDGCDAAIVRVDRESKIVEFAGAKIDLFHIKASRDIVRYEATRISLGYVDAPEKKPELLTINYEVGDGFVIVSDGLTDQIGGNDGNLRAYGYRRLEALLKSVASNSAADIAETMKADLKTWQGPEIRRDDVSALIFRL